MLAEDLEIQVDKAAYEMVLTKFPQITPGKI